MSSAVAVRRALLGALLLGLCRAPAAAYSRRDDAKARELARKAAQVGGRNPQGRCYFFVLKALKSAGLLPSDYWKRVSTSSAYQFAFGRKRASPPPRFPLRMVGSYAPWKEGTIVVWNRDPDSRHSCGRGTALGKRHGHIEIVVDPRRMGRRERLGSYMSCFGSCGYTSVQKVNAYLRKGCVRVYEPARWESW